MVTTETVELKVTKSHAERLQECDETLNEMDVRRELAELVMQSIDDTYRQVASQEEAQAELLREQ